MTMMPFEINVGAVGGEVQVLFSLPGADAPCAGGRWGPEAARALALELLRAAREAAASRHLDETAVYEPVASGPAARA